MLSGTCWSDQGYFLGFVYNMYIHTYGRAFFVMMPMSSSSCLNVRS